MRAAFVEKRFQGLRIRMDTTLTGVVERETVRQPVPAGVFSGSDRIKTCAHN